MILIVKFIPNPHINVCPNVTIIVQHHVITLIIKLKKSTIAPIIGILLVIDNILLNPFLNEKNILFAKSEFMQDIPLSIPFMESLKHG